MNYSSKSKLTVAGSGLVGSLLAIYLRKMGNDVEVFEKRPDPRTAGGDGGRSINLVLTSKGLRALDSIGIRDEIQRLSVPVSGRIIHSLGGELSYQPYGRDKSECNYSISRAELNKALISLAEKEGAKFYFDHELEKVDLKNRKLKFKNSKVTQFQYLFGTDGVGSQVRGAVMAHHGEGGNTCIEPFVSDYKELLLNAKPDGSYPISEEGLHIWPRGKDMMMALPNQGGSFTLTLYTPTTGPLAMTELNTNDEVRAYFEKQYSDLISLVPDYVEQFNDNPVGKLATIRCPHWTDGKTTLLLGDASHGITPFFGQGMNSGFDDCYFLNKIFSVQNNWADTFIEFEKIQAPKANAIADMAIENYVEMADRSGDPGFQRRKKIEHKLENQFRDSFLSRYSMVTHTLIPYDLCFEAGQINDMILDTLCQDVAYQNSQDDLEFDLELAAKLIDHHLKPFLDKHGLDTDVYF